MSSESELERLLREGRATIPEPDAASTRRAHERVRAAIRRRRPRRLRVAALLGVAAVVAVGLGVGLGALIAPSGTAASRPVGFGFMPEPGWQALQAAAPSMAGQPQVAMAANVPFAADDVVHGLAEPSALPYSTLLSLPARGAVIVVTLTEPEPNQPPSTRYPALELPLRIRDATPYIEYGTQLRPDEPLGQYQLRSVLNGRYLDVHVYFGMPQPSSALRRAAQRQLDRLVVRSATPPEQERAGQPTRTASPSAPGLIDRTFVCAPALIGGVRQIDTRAHKGSGRGGSGWDRPAFASVSTTVSGAAATAVEDELVWIAAGPPSASSTVVSTLVGYTFPFRVWGTLAVNGKLCRGSTARVPLARTKLQGGGVGPIDDRWDCVTGRRVVVRVRAILDSKASLKSYRGFLRTTVPVKSASLAVRTEAGKPLVYAQVLESGRSFLFTSPSCFPD